MATIVGEQSSTSTTVPAFLLKLWLLVEDETTNDLIHWSSEGNSFVVVNQNEFAKDVLPRYFKHNNMTSFIRQLNMYGFRKKTHPEAGGLIHYAETDEIEFQHPSFIKGQQQKLEHIKRKQVSTKEDVKFILTDVKDIKNKQEDITGALNNIKKENESLWRELVYLRKRHDHQQKIISRLIQFLMTMAQPKKGVKRKPFPMIEGMSSNKYAKQGSIIPDEFFTPNQDEYGKGSNGRGQSPGLILSEIIDPETQQELFNLADDNVSSSNTRSMEADNQGTSTSLIEEGDVLETLSFPIITSPGGTLDNQEENNRISSTSSSSPTIVPQDINLERTIAQPSQQFSDNSGMQLMPVNQMAGGELVRQNSYNMDSVELGDHMNTIQSNLDFIQSLIASNPDIHQSDLLQHIFLPSNNAPVDYSQNFLSSLANSNITNSVSNANDSQLVQVNPSSQINQSESLPSSVFTEEEEDSLLNSLKEDQAALARDSSLLGDGLFSDVSLSTPILQDEDESRTSALEDAINLL